jgi:hypothetical protein
MSKKIFCLDADLSNPTLTLINCINREEVVMVNNTFNSNHREYYMSQDERDWMDDIKSKLWLGKKLFIVCLSEEKAHDIHRQLCKVIDDVYMSNRKKTPPNISLCITSSMDEKNKREMENVDEMWKDKELVITTSATGAGIDFTLSHFDYIYGYIYAGLSPPAEFLQICHRVRNPKNNRIYVMCNSNMKLPEYTYDPKRGELTYTNSFIFTINNAKKYIDVVKETVITNPVYKSKFNEEKGCMMECTEEWDKDYSKLQYYEYLSNYLNNQASNYLLVLKLLIHQHGDVFNMDPIKVKQKRRTDKKNKLNETKITGIDFYELKKNKNMTTAVNRDQFDKNKMCNLFRIKKEHRDDELKNICDVYKNKMNIYTLSKVVHMNTETQMKVSKKNDKPTYDTINNKAKQNLITVYKNFLDVSKYNYEDKFKIDVKQMDKIYEEMNITRQQKMSITRNTNMVDNKIILTVLRNFGLKLTKGRKRRLNDEKKLESITDCYYIIPDEKIYECLYMELYDVEGYDENFMKLVRTFNKYDPIINTTKKQHNNTLPNINILRQNTDKEPDTNDELETNDEQLIPA